MALAGRVTGYPGLPVRPDEALRWTAGPEPTKSPESFADDSKSGHSPATFLPLHSTRLNGIPSQLSRRSFFHRPCSECRSSAPKVYRRWHSHDLTKGRRALTAGGRLDAVDRIGEYLKAILESLETWPKPGISADVPRETGKAAWLRRQCCRAVISAMLIWIYRCLEAAGTIEHLDAAAAYHFTERLPRNIGVAP
jgi:hypothetical protein